MANFEFFSVPRIVFGRGQFARVGEFAAALGSSAIVICNGPEDLANRLVGLLSSAGVAWQQVRQRGEPRIEDVDAAVEHARRSRCDMAIGLGGGSAIDAAKAVAGLLANGGSALDYMEVIGAGRKIVKTAVPWIAIPTTAGAGAEVTRNAVIGAPEKKFKASIRGEQLLAKIALVDPELGASVPAQVTASSGMDALCQCIEAYTSIGAQPITDALALQGISLAARALRKAYADGNDLDARENMAMAALLGGISLTNAGLGAVHGFAAPLGANFPAPHGTVCATLLPHVIEANIAALRARDSNHPTLAKYAVIGRLFAGAKDQGDDAAIDRAVEACSRLASDLHIPTLGQYEMSEADVPAMVALAKKASSMRFNPIILSDEALTAILSDSL